MPTAYIKKLAKEKGRSVSSLEKDWSKAKAIAAEEGHKEDYGYVTAIFKKIAKIDEGTTFKDFLNIVDQ